MFDELKKIIRLDSDEIKLYEKYNFPGEKQMLIDM